MTGYASKDAYINGSLPIADPRAYTWGNYGKGNIKTVYNFAYNLLKTHEDFKDGKDDV